MSRTDFSPWLPGQLVLFRSDVIKEMPQFRRRGLSDFQATVTALESYKVANEAIARLMKNK